MAAAPMTAARTGGKLDTMSGRAGGSGRAFSAPPRRVAAGPRPPTPPAAGISAGRGNRPPGPASRPPPAARAGPPRPREERPPAPPEGPGVHPDPAPGGARDRARDLEPAETGRTRTVEADGVRRAAAGQQAVAVGLDRRELAGELH